MANSRQKTLFETWNKNSGSLFQGRGGSSNFQRGGSVRQTILKDGARGRRGQPNRRSDRGGGRVARGSSISRVGVSNTELNDGTIVIDDDDDDICQQALGQAELANNDVTAAFIDLNAAKDLPGFDKEAGSIWIYPTNCAVRNYQFDIVQTALFNNTLVSLPTGMGKTFIAAVVMYNLHRWYPHDYIVFMAPTKPLVTQQLEACHNIVGIHPSKTVELTGNILPKKREDLWKSKTVFFLTPQVMISDLNRGACPFNKVRCLVVDEAHKAMGNHAYVQVISKIAEYQKQFRVLALSATPGSDMLAVQQVFKNLMISKVELRSEDSTDLLPYTHKKQIEKIVVDLDAYIMSIDMELKQIFQLYTGKLMQLKILSGKDGSSFTQFQLLKARDFYRNSPPPSIPNYQKGYIESDFATCISLAHALELLVIHGVRSCYVFLQGICDKERGHGAVSAELRKNVALRTLLNEIQEKLNISVENSTLSFSSSALFTTFSSDSNTSHYIPQEGKETDYALSHPKLGVLKNIVVKHFQSFQMKNETTRVMIFSQYRDSVQEIVSMLNTLRPLVKPAIFVGQAKSGAGGAGLNQKKQGEVLQDFRDGKYNVLASTCVGEEGLNIGEVDLIICFDASKSPTRLVQRMGRTGRQRQGKTIFLLTRGKEERTYHSSVNMQGNISRNITDVSKFQPYLYQFSPRMVPAGLDPVCYKMKVVLSSEREEYGDTASPKNQSGKNTENTKPGKAHRHKAQRKQVNKNEDKPAKSSKSVETKIDDAFKNVAAKSAFANLPFNATVDVKSELKVLTDIIEREMDIYHHYIENSEIDLDNRRFLYDLFDIEDSNENCASCIFIPTPPSVIVPIGGSTAPLTDAEREALLLDESELQFLKAKNEAAVLIGSRNGRCVCGNINTTVLDLYTGDLKSFSPDEECLEKNKNDFKKGNTNYNWRSTVRNVVQKTETRSRSSPFNMKKLVTNTKDNYVNKEEVDFDADVAFMFDENDPFLNDDDDWMNEINDNCKVEIKEERSISKSPVIQRFKDSDAANRISPKSENSVTTQNLKSRTTISNKADKLDIPIIKSTEQPLVGYTQTEYANIFADEILFDDESEGENNACDIKNEKEFQTKEDSDIFKSEQIEGNAPNENKLNDSSTASKGMFSPCRSKQKDKRFKFAAKSCVQSTPKNALKFVADDFSQPIVDIDNENNYSDDLFPTSPDLSQYRLQNQVKRAKLDSESYCPISNTYANMTAPENDSANMLNRFVDEMRQKHSQSPLTQAAKKIEKSENNSNVTSDLSSEKPKKKFVFKKRSSGSSNQELSIISPVPPVQKIDSKNIAYDDIILPPPDTFKTFINEPRKLIGLSRLTNGIGFGKNPILSPTETIDRKKKFNFERTHLKNDGIENIQNDIRQYKMQYCSEDILDVADLDVFLHDSKERSRLKDIQEQNRTKIEQNRLKAIELRKSKMMKTQEASSLQSLTIIQPIKHEKIDSSIKLPGNKTCQAVQQENIEIPPMKQETGSTLMTVPRSMINPKRQHEHIKTATPIEVQTKSKIETNKSNSRLSSLSRKTTKAYDGAKFNNRKPSVKIPDALGFSDDDDFDFVRPQPRQLNQMNSTFKSPQHLLKPLSLREKQIMVTQTSPEFLLKRNIRRKLTRNPYIEDEAEASDKSSDCDGDDDLEELDEFDDSFVTQNYDDEITNTQQVRYVESTKDLMPVPFSRVERECLPIVFDPLHSYSEYEHDSFCVNNDEVDFAEVGAFTQAMNKAKSDLEIGGDNGKRQTRRAERLKQINAEYMAESNKESNGDRKKRRRVIILDSSDED